MRALRTALATALFAVVAAPAYAHVGVGETTSFAAGFGHPLSGLDHITVMIAVGLWAALKGGKALWVWPASFVGVMLVGGGLGMAGVALPFVEPAILASVVALGLMVALAIDLPIWTGAAIIGAFALFHGHAHGMEVPESASGLDYIAGFALATAALHAVGVAAGVGLGTRSRIIARAGGVVCAVFGLGMIAGVV